MPADARHRAFLLVSFGCRVNQAEGLALASRLRRMGLAEAAAESDAGLVVVNTCAVTGEAARQARQRIRRAVRAGADVVVTGCAAHPAAADAALRRIPGLLLVQPDKDRVAEWLRSRLGPEAVEAPSPEPPPGRSRALLKVQDGCPASCAYCIVPRVRPTVSSVPPEEAARRLEALVAAGYREVVVCGIHLGLYGAGGTGGDLAALLRRLLAVPGVGRLRLSSLEPMEVTPGLLALMASEPERLCPHLHLPLQSGDDEVLSRMGRPYTGAEFLRQVGRIRAALPRPAVTTDVLVGFPGETDAAFRRTLGLCREAGFSRLHVFPFSRRPGTRAATMGGQVPADAVRDRRREAAALGEVLAAAYRDSLVGTRAAVVIEKRLAGGGAEGLSERFVRVRVAPPLPPGAERRQVLDVRILRAGDGLLEARAE